MHPTASADMQGETLVVVAFVVGLIAVLRRPRGSASRRRSVSPVAFEQTFVSGPGRLRFVAFENVIVADQRGMTEIDVIVVGANGVFVVEIKDFNAWIFGSERDEMWTASYPDRSKHRFQNPLRQNHRHVMALQAKTGLPPNVFHSIVAFTGDCRFKTPMPSSVVASGYREVIGNTPGIRLSDDDIERVCRVLGELKADSTEEAMEAHVAALQARFSSATTCPKCGSRLVERRRRSGSAGNAAFLACASFPRCRYTRSLPDATA